MEYSTGKCNIITILSLVIMHPLHTASSVVVPCLGSVGWPNSSKRVRCCQKRQSSGDRKKFCHIRSFFCLGVFDFLLTRPPAGEIQRKASRFSERKVTVAAISIKLSYARTTD